MTPLKLIALDAEDLQVMSAHLQDAVVRVADMTFLKAERRFAAVANRFDWGSVKDGPKDTSEAIRRRTGLRFERVQTAQVSNLNLTSKDTVLSLLAISFAASAEPDGIVTLHFSGGAAIRLTVDCIEAEMKDLGAAWATNKIPTHGDDPGAS
jgi:Protein of unknown function (DUF2948)